MSPTSRATLLALALALAAPARSAAAEPLPPPSRDPWTTRGAADPEPRARRAAKEKDPGPEPTLGDGPVAPAGSQAAALRGEAGASGWRGALGTGLAGKWGGMRLESAHPNANVLLYFGGQADASWSEGHGTGARLRFRLLTGGEGALYAPSDGDAEAAFLFGPKEFRFVVARVEVARAPALGVEALAQAGTLPSFEGDVPLAGGAARLAYFLAPVEGAWVYYAGGAHIGKSAAAPSESDRVSAATAARVRASFLLPPGVVLSAQGDLMKLWGKADLLAAAEAAIGFRALQRAALFQATVRWDTYTRRAKTPDASAREEQLLLLASATLAL